MENLRARPRIALAGNPNCGKTSLFNLLTGASQEVGNFPGVTVEYTVGHSEMEGKWFDVVDLPGTYSLTAYSKDEIVTRDYLLNERPDLIVNVLDASTLDRQLYLTAQLLEMRLPMVIALNMKDVAERHGIVIDSARMSAIIGVPVVLTDASRADGLDELKSACAHMAAEPTLPQMLSCSHELEDVVAPVLEQIRATPGLPPRLPEHFLALKLLEHDSGVQSVLDAHPEFLPVIAAAEKKLLAHSGEDPALAISEARLGIASGIVRECVKMTKPDRRSFSDRIDEYACSRFLGPLILMGVVYLLFQAIFGIAENIRWVPYYSGGAWNFASPTGLLESGFENLSAFAAAHISSALLRSLVCDGIIGGVGGVLTFVPLIFVMFFFIAFLEDTGYIARVAFILDRILRVFGLQGKSILSLIVSGGLGGGGCAVPGILATRTLREEKDRYITIMVTPMMNCGAKFPLYALLIGAFFSRHQGAMMFLLWLLSWFFSMSAAWILRKTVFRGGQTPFIMELPVYHMPRLRGVMQHTWMRTWMYIRKAGTIILGFSVLIWLMMYFPRLNEKQLAEYDGERAAAESCGDAASVRAKLAEIDAREKNDQLRNSFAGRIGGALTPISDLAGFSWRENVALLGGVAAKEIVVGTLGTAYSMSGDSEDNKKLGERLAASPGWSPLKAFALIIFVMLYAPCMAAVVAIKRETNSWKWMFFSIAYSTTFAFIAATLIYRVGLLI